MNIDNISNTIRNSHVRITDHTYDVLFDDILTYEEMYSSVVQGKVIEDYPNDKPYPCLSIDVMKRAYKSIITLVGGIILS